MVEYRMKFVYPILSPLIRQNMWSIAKTKFQYDSETFVNNLQKIFPRESDQFIFRTRPKGGTKEVDG